MKKKFDLRKVKFKNIIFLVAIDNTEMVENFLKKSTSKLYTTIEIEKKLRKSCICTSLVSKWENIKFSK